MGREVERAGRKEGGGMGEGAEQEEVGAGGDQLLQIQTFHSGLKV